MEATSIQNTVNDLDLAISQQKKDMQEEYQRHQEAVRKYEEKMANFKTSLEALQTKRKRFHSALSPIRMLHPEILSLIFITYFELYTNGNRFVDSDTRPQCKTSCGLTRLALVCTRWYEVLLETPRLWGTITIDIGANNKSLDRLTSAIMRHLARSKQAPLHLDFHFGRIGTMARHFHPQNLDSGDGFLEIFAAEQSRWRHVKIDAGIFMCPDSDKYLKPRDAWYESRASSESEDDYPPPRLVTDRVMQDLFNKPEIGGFTFPLLESLEVDRAGLRLRAIPKLVFIQHCPILQRLSLSGYPPTFLSGLQNWNQITRLDLKALHVDDVLQALSLCPNVVSVQIALECIPHYVVAHVDDDDPDPQPSHVVSSSIRDLTITVSPPKDRTQPLTWGSLDELLRLLICPSLQSFELAITGLIRDDPGFSFRRMKKLISTWPADTLFDFITRTRTNFTDNSASPDAGLHSLRVLKLKDLPLTPENLLSILEMIPSLRDLTVHEMKERRSTWSGPRCNHHIPNNTLVDSFFEAMIIDGRRPIILPHLQRIELKLHISSHEKDIEKVIHTRWDVAHDSACSSSPADQLQCAVIELIGDSENQPRDWFSESESGSGSGLYGIRNAGMLIKVAWETPGEKEQGQEKGRVVIPLKDGPGPEVDQKPQGLDDDDLDVDVDEYFAGTELRDGWGTGAKGKEEGRVLRRVIMRAVESEESEDLEGLEEEGDGEDDDY
ncbi:hypothetical protein D9758_013923 [Tetrapyrgos nigripes]|uniref:F-box domain-containing protein n=1 Tax=Tetrapyrgos nigripes TaxID=182062 RepID=A0A8H5CMV1_9AGAR|nr:hypothetical protein D9758_013923 [Tetrapyrgos nigripes]